MRTDERIEQARTACDQAIFNGDASALAAAERGLDALDADTALARGRILHARFQHARAEAEATAIEDPAELPLFECARELYHALGDTGGEAEALFWIGCVHQYIRRDDETAVPQLEQSLALATRAGDRATRSEALRHLGIAAHTAGRFDDARERLEESSRLRWEIGEEPGVASNMVGLAYIATAQGRHADAVATLDEAYGIARAHGAEAIVKHIEEARAHIQASPQERAETAAATLVRRASGSGA